MSVDGNDRPIFSACQCPDPVKCPKCRAESLYRSARAICDTDLKTAIELRQLAGRIERGEA